MSEESVTKVTVDIYGRQYTLKGKASQAHIMSVARLVDEKMRALSSKNPSLDLTRTAVLTAVNLADEYRKLKEEYDELLELVESATRGKQK